MKLRTLIIKNIASIEDAAIAFDGAALGATDLFLICGPTGSGKSTILDAICLALFNDTPRVNNAPSSEKIDLGDSEAAKGRIKLKDSKNLIRKNAANASVKLTFQGTDGHEYTAHWEMTRANQFAKGKESSTYAKESLEDKLKRSMNMNWWITDDTAEIDYKKVDEIRECVKQAIGLEFKDFCKTTMLAQGEFTRFLSSTGEEKAIILEKLVGTEIYAKVGEAINETTNQKKSEMQVAQLELKNCNLMSADDIAEREQQIAQLDADIKQLEAKSKAIEEKLNFIAQKQRLENELAGASQKLAAACADLESEAAKQDHRVVDLWDNTLDLRIALKKQAELQAYAVALGLKRESLERDYDLALAAMAWQESSKEELGKKIEAEKRDYAAQQPFQDTYGRVDVICTTHDNIVKWKRYIAENTPLIDTYDSKILAYQQQKAQLDKSVADAKEEIAGLDCEQERLRQVLRENRADSLVDEINANNKRSHDVEAAKAAYDLSEEAKKKLEQKTQEVESDKAKIEALQQEVAACEIQRNQAESVYKESKSLYEKVRESVSDHAKILRAKLQKGDHCPVCGKEIDEIVSDESFQQTLRPLQIKYEADEKACEEAKNKHLQAAAALGQACKASEKSAREVEIEKKNLNAKLKDLQEKSLAAKIEINGDILLQINILKEGILSKSKGLADRQKIVVDTRSKIDKNDKYTQQIRTERIEKINEQSAKITANIDAENQKRATLKGQIESNKASMAAAEHSLDELINHQWQAPDGVEYYKALRAAAENYSCLQQQIENDERKMETCHAELANMQSLRKVILSVMPAWTEMQVGLPRQLDNASHHWSQLQANCVNQEKQEHDNREQQCAVEGVIAHFKEAHSEIDMEEIANLAAMTDNQIAQIRNRAEMRRQVEATARNLLQDVNRRKSELQMVAIEENETAEQLQADKNKVAEDSSSAAEKIGGIRAQLAQDKIIRQQYGEKKKELDRLAAEYEEWKYLDTYLGSTKGKNFRQVAQSFILGDLLEKANAYLRNISDRYTLFCYPGTLTIMLRDAEQGGAERPTNTLSGGESFIVSLSLALGLSSMHSTGFEVDTLFIDEGFGTLSQEYLEPVILALKRLYQVYGRRVGIISHVESLRSRIPVCIEVTKKGTNPSDVKIVAYGQ